MLAGTKNGALTFTWLGVPDYKARASLVAQLVKQCACKGGDSGSIPGTGRSPGEGIGYPLQYSWVPLVVQSVKNPPAMQETWVWSLGWEDPLEEGMATHFSSLSGESPWTREPGGLRFTGSQRVRHYWATKHSTAQHCTAKGNFTLSKLLLAIGYTPSKTNDLLTAWYLSWKSLHLIISVKIRSGKNHPWLWNLKEISMQGKIFLKCLLTDCLLVARGKYDSYKMKKPENILPEGQNLHHQGGEMTIVCTTLPREHFHQEHVACIQPGGNVWQNEKRSIKKRWRAVFF